MVPNLSHLQGITQTLNFHDKFDLECQDQDYKFLK